jgi:hypothetical protein
VRAERFIFRPAFINDVVGSVVMDSMAREVREYVWHADFGITARIIRDTNNSILREIRREIRA